jgi:hypothetical protein
MNFPHLPIGWSPSDHYSEGSSWVDSKARHSSRKTAVAAGWNQTRKELVRRERDEAVRVIQHLTIILSITLTRGESMLRGRWQPHKTTNTHGFIYYHESSAIGQWHPSSGAT